MTASAIIDEIQALPPEEKAKVVDFVAKMKSNDPIRYAAMEKAREAMREVFTEHRELMQKLSQ